VTRLISGSETKQTKKPIHFKLFEKIVFAKYNNQFK